MKIDRLIGIITTLQQKGKVTAPYLAEKFEVSRRTISRDIEDINRAGIPIVTTQGVDGGIEIMQEFQLDTTVFTEEELQSILVGLQSLDSVSTSRKHMRLSEKLGAVVPLTDSMMIDLSSFYKGSLSEKIELLQEAIREHKCVRFHYYYGKGEADKSLEPMLVVFKWSNWYVFGFCRERQDFRMYKLNRLWDLQMTSECFQPREIPKERLQFGQNITDDKVITAVYEASEAYKLVEEYGPDSYTVQEDGRLYTEWGFSSYESALSWFLGFGGKVRILGPEDFREQYIAELRNMLQKYEGT